LETHVTLLAVFRRLLGMAEGRNLAAGAIHQADSGRSGQAGRGVDDPALDARRNLSCRGARYQASHETPAVKVRSPVVTHTLIFSPTARGAGDGRNGCDQLLRRLHTGSYSRTSRSWRV
jgi:hypothetical protein